MDYNNEVKIIRTATTARVLKIVLRGQLKHLSENGFKVFSMSADGSEIKSLYENEHIVEHFNINIKRKISLFHDIISLIQCFLIFKKLKPTIVHSITPKAGLISMIAGYFAKVPVRIHTFTGLIFPSKKGIYRLLLLFMDRMICAFSTSVYAEGLGVKHQLEKNKITQKPLKIISNGSANGVNEFFFCRKNISNKDLIKIRNELSIQDDDFIFLFVGRLVRDKGINELVGAFIELEKEIPKIKLLLVGNYEHDLDYLGKSTLKKISQNKSIFNIGFKDDVRPYYAISNVLLLPSYREGFPNVLLEGACFSLPIIATNVNGCNEIIKEKVNGILIPPKNKMALKNAMNLLYNNKALRTKFSKNTRNMIITKYTNAKVWEATIFEYKKLLTNFNN